MHEVKRGSKLEQRQQHAFEMIKFQMMSGDPGGSAGGEGPGWPDNFEALMQVCGVTGTAYLNTDHKKEAAGASKKSDAVMSEANEGAFLNDLRAFNQALSRINKEMDATGRRGSIGHQTRSLEKALGDLVTRLNTNVEGEGELTVAHQSPQVVRADVNQLLANINEQYQDMIDKERDKKLKQPNVILQGHRKTKAGAADDESAGRRSSRDIQMDELRKDNAALHAQLEHLQAAIRNAELNRATAADVAQARAQAAAAERALAAQQARMAELERLHAHDAAQIAAGHEATQGIREQMEALQANQAALEAALVAAQQKAADAEATAAAAIAGAAPPPPAAAPDPGAPPAAAPDPGAPPAAAPDPGAPPAAAPDPGAPPAAGPAPAPVPPPRKPKKKAAKVEKDKGKVFDESVLCDSQSYSVPVRDEKGNLKTDADGKYQRANVQGPAFGMSIADSQRVKITAGLMGAGSLYEGVNAVRQLVLDSANDAAGKDAKTSARNAQQTLDMIDAALSEEINLYYKAQAAAADPVVDPADPTASKPAVPPDDKAFNVTPDNIADARQLLAYSRSLGRAMQATNAQLDAGIIPQGIFKVESGRFVVDKSLAEGANLKNQQAVMHNLSAAVSDMRLQGADDAKGTKLSDAERTTKLIDFNKQKDAEKALLNQAYANQHLQRGFFAEKLNGLGRANPDRTGFWKKLADGLAGTLGIETTMFTDRQALEQVLSNPGIVAGNDGMKLQANSKGNLSVTFTGINKKDIEKGNPEAIAKFTRQLKRFYDAAMLTGEGCSEDKPFDITNSAIPPQGKIAQLSALMALSYERNEPIFVEDNGHVFKITPDMLKMQQSELDKIQAVKTPELKDKEGEHEKPRTMGDLHESCQGALNQLRQSREGKPILTHMNNSQVMSRMQVKAGDKTISLIEAEQRYAANTAQLLASGVLGRQMQVYESGKPKGQEYLKLPTAVYGMSQMAPFCAHYKFGDSTEEKRRADMSKLFDKRYGTVDPGAMHAMPAGAGPAPGMLPGMGGMGAPPPIPGAGPGLGGGGVTPPDPTKPVTKPK